MGAGVVEAAEVGLDGGQVVPEQGVGGAEPDGGLGVGEGLGRAAGLAQGPAEGVVGEDGRPGGACGRGPWRRRPRAGVVGLEAGEFQVDGHAGLPVQGLDLADEVVGGGGVGGAAEGGLDVAQQGQPRRLGKAGGDVLEEGGGAGQVAPGRGHPGQAGLGGGGVGPPEGPAVGAFGVGQAAGAEMEVAEQGLDVGDVAGGGAGAGDGGLGHGRHRARDVAVQLAEVRRPGQAGQRRPAVEHLLEGGGGVVVAAELDVGVDDDAERLGGGRVERMGPPAELECGGEVVAAEGQQAQAGEGGRAVGATAPGCGRAPGRPG